MRITKIKTRPPLKLTPTQKRPITKMPINNNSAVKPMPITIQQLPAITKPIPLIITWIRLPNLVAIEFICWKYM